VIGNGAPPRCIQKTSQQRTVKRANQRGQESRRLSFTRFDVSERGYTFLSLTAGYEAPFHSQVMKLLLTPRDLDLDILLSQDLRVAAFRTVPVPPLSGDTTPCKVIPVILHGVVFLPLCSLAPLGVVGNSNVLIPDADGIPNLPTFCSSPRREKPAGSLEPML